MSVQVVPPMPYKYLPGVRLGAVVRWKLGHRPDIPFKRGTTGKQIFIINASIAQREEHLFGIQEVGISKFPTSPKLIRLTHLRGHARPRLYEAPNAPLV